ncbi:MAG: HAD family hydrolase [Planctomycetota bacterium]|jgi:putative hydrolase of the HAD superfamily
MTTDLRAVFLDLDDTLLDTNGLLVGPARLEAGAAMVEAGLPGTAEEAAEDLERMARERPGENPFPLVAAERGADDVSIGIAGWGAFFKRSVPETLPVMDGVEETLDRLAQAGIRRILVTFGDQPTQHAKIVAAGLMARLDRIVYEPLSSSADKLRAFRLLCEEESLDPAACLAVGDRPDAEIAAGRALGMRTIRLRRGEHRFIEPEDPAHIADNTVETFAEAAALILGS